MKNSQLIFSLAIGLLVISLGCASLLLGQAIHGFFVVGVGLIVQTFWSMRKTNLQVGVQTTA